MIAPDAPLPNDEARLPAGVHMPQVGAHTTDFDTITEDQIFAGGDRSLIWWQYGKKRTVVTAGDLARVREARKIVKKAMTELEIFDATLARAEQVLLEDEQRALAGAEDAEQPAAEQPATEHAAADE